MNRTPTVFAARQTEAIHGLRFFQRERDEFHFESLWRLTQKATQLDQSSYGARIVVRARQFPRSIVMGANNDAFIGVRSEDRNDIAVGVCR